MNSRRGIDALLDAGGDDLLAMSLTAILAAQDAAPRSSRRLASGEALKVGDVIRVGARYAPGRIVELKPYEGNHRGHPEWANARYAVLDRNNHALARIVVFPACLYLIEE